MDNNTSLAPANVTTSPISRGEMLAIEIATRTTSVFSVLGSIFILSSFVWFKFFRKPINRLVFMATFGNLLANVATLTSRSGIPKGSKLTGLCEFQGVLIQWFMMADALWVFCMATNVYLVFFHGFNSQQLHGLEKYYFLLAYGIPAIPAISYVVLDHTGHRVIGPASLWCWVATDVDWMRISFFYAPVWVVVSATMAIYLITGRKIYAQRAHLRSFSQKSPPSAHASAIDSTPNEDNPANSKPVDNKIFVTTQIKYDVRPNSSTGRSSRDASPERGQLSVESLPSTAKESIEQVNDDTPNVAPTILAHGEQRAGQGIQSEADEQSCYRATAFATTTNSASTPLRPGSSRAVRPTKTRQTDGHDAAMAYFKVAFLMFIALVVVWVPSSVNRVYQFTHKGAPNFTLNLISALVLPLQGSWNATIYIFTTKRECKRAWRLITKKTDEADLDDQPYHMDSLTSHASHESDAELVMDPIYQKHEQRRHSELSHPDSIVDSKSPHNQVTPC